MGDGPNSKLQPFAPYHQLATLAPSKEDILQHLEFFFGKAPQPEKLHDFMQHHQATEHFVRSTRTHSTAFSIRSCRLTSLRFVTAQPDAYNGQNVHLRDTLNNLILSSPESWQTQAGLPWTKIDGVTVTWDEVHFDVRLLQRVPVRSCEWNSGRT